MHIDIATLHIPMNSRDSYNLIGSTRFPVEPAELEREQIAKSPKPSLCDQRDRSIRACVCIYIYTKGDHVLEMRRARLGLGPAGASLVPRPPNE